MHVDITLYCNPPISSTVLEPQKVDYELAKSELFDNGEVLIMNHFYQSMPSIEDVGGTGSKNVDYELTVRK
ncbi:hypothetical protein RclHR1_00990014 [Rhizophagus clarus]|uniref:Uncharacterized protein n=1 Tax=Rhizophagus clarus TaxID=94130 RepID=A0A2Z6S7W6_9GLOM|nr:hypothetical protein RclHR1_00990014 [Rhizophagus clarus]